MKSTDVIYLTRHPHRSPPGDVEITFDAFRGGGPGGQKRNKTSTAVRAVHTPTGLHSVCDDGRNQHDNRKLALSRLRYELTVRCRNRIYLDRLEPPQGYEPADLDLSAKSERFLEVLGFVLDVLQAAGFV